MANWIVCQDGSREQYAIAHALAKQNVLYELCTDIWIEPDNLAYKRLIKNYPRLASRYNPGLVGAKVHHRNVKFLVSLILNRLLNQTIDDSVFSNYFGSCVKNSSLEDGVVFAYSYTGAKAIHEAKKKGYVAILGQVDAGPFAGRLITDLHVSTFGTKDGRHDLYETYEPQWRQTSDLADFIVVNSSWSKACLIEEGIPTEKIRVVPLVYEAPTKTSKFKRNFKMKFSRANPLEILFLGRLSLQKGILLIQEIAKELTGDPVRFTLVGSINIPEQYLDLPANVRWFQHVPYHQTHNFYQQADLFILPTYSDGFARTQLEAQYWGLPVFTTPFCGNVVKDGINGTIIQQNSVSSWVEVIKDILSNPSILERYSANSVSMESYTLDAVGRQLISIIE